MGRNAPYRILKNMDINLEMVMSQMKELQKYADELWEIRSSLVRYKEIINDVWVSTETENINDIIDGLKRKTERLIDEIYIVGYDMLKACNEL